MFGPDKWDIGFGGIWICAVTYGPRCGTISDIGGRDEFECMRNYSNHVGLGSRNDCRCCDLPLIIMMITD